MARRTVISYAFAHTIGGTTSITLYFMGGGSVSVGNLPVAEAAHMLDLLRNEKPLRFDDDLRQLATGTVEPVGEGE